MPNSLHDVRAMKVGKKKRSKAQHSIGRILPQTTPRTAKVNNAMLQVSKVNPHEPLDPVVRETMLPKTRATRIPRAKKSRALHAGSGGSDVGEMQRFETALLFSELTGEVPQTTEFTKPKKIHAVPKLRKPKSIPKTLSRATRVRRLPKSVQNGD